ncbi:hypothetical protein MMC18_007410 [Xylographa bjoerkii]|nr:hypothetical protein [Xylographa bjoerkii]MCJ1394531.1 hypothetical protein [Xylographa bjoerkii]
MRNPTAVAPLSPSELPPRRRHYRSPSPPDSPLYETRVPWGSRAASSSVNARYETCVRKGFRSPSPAVSARFETRKPSCRSPAPPYPRSPSSLSDAHTPKEPRYPSPSPSLRARFEAWKKAHPDLSSPEPLSPEYETVEPKGYRSPPPQSDHSSRSPSPASGSSAHTDTSPLPTPPPISSLPASAIRDLLVGRTYCYWPDFRLADIFKRKYPAHKALHDHATLVAVYLQLERDKGGEWAKWAGEGAVEERKRVHEELHADGERWGDRQVALDGMGWACRRCAEDGGTYRKVLSEGEGRARKEWNRRRGG